jgi:hypothetical protein
MTNPSPHLEVQVPVAELQFGSAWQVGEQPSFGIVLPSSQPSVPSTFPSPHTVWWQLGGLPLQAQPGFHLQVEEHASAMFAAWTPGSHCSIGASTMPSPQSGTQGAFAKGQTYPVSIVHIDEQPSPLLMLPSS